MQNLGSGARTAARVKVVIEREGRYLLALHHNRVPENKGKWTFLGGLIDATDVSGLTRTRLLCPPERVCEPFPHDGSHPLGVRRRNSAG
jgi:hypothetical protein